MASHSFEVDGQVEAPPSSIGFLRILHYDRVSHRLDTSLATSFR